MTHPRLQIQGQKLFGNARTEKMLHAADTVPFDLKDCWKPLAASWKHSSLQEVADPLTRIDPLHIQELLDLQFQGGEGHDL